ncbi:fused response regulator/phosphatase [Alteromonas gilva]|uniref:Fused response regulator/phosphatase n=1 Tax=Alteromonas gilva TaxID=2987522 RepID=A0ABT5L3D1_9ALTE|nr:fused response regulator/phosphatase [Alteromonas gilva]MDC8831537.1 fused response regulator/phosphatase [Alteromonas gilva]
MLKVLIVDDEEINRIMLTEILREAGYTDCVEAENGVQAIEKARDCKPDIVLLDVIMPGMSGLEVAPLLKAMSPECHMPVLFITSLDDEQSLVNCLECGGDDFIAKPFEKIILYAKLAAHARSRRLSLEIQDKNRSLTYFQQEVERNHRIVEHIFDNALAHRGVEKSYFDLYTQPTTQFNGDLFLCEQSPSGGTYLFVGDFTSHGLASAIGAIPVAQAFTSMTKRGMAVQEIASRLNALLYSLLPADMFCVAAIIEISRDGKQFIIWSGGLPRMAVKTADSLLRYTIDAQHMPLGILSDDEFEQTTQVFQAQEGDTLLVYTDGLMECQHPTHGLLGEEGVEAWFVGGQNVTSAALVAKAIEYTGGLAPDDDLTVVQFCCRPFEFDASGDKTIGGVPFTLSFHLQAEQIKQSKLIDHLMGIVNSVPGLAVIRSEIFTVLTELTNNAIEHGLLGLSSTMKAEPEGFIEYYELRAQRLANLTTGDIWIDISYPAHPGAPAQTKQSSVPPQPYQLLEIAVRDNGPGFSETTVKNAEDEAYGRGLALIRELCQQVDIADGGNKVRVLLKV